MGVVAPFPKQSLSLESLTLNRRGTNIFAASSTFSDLLFTGRPNVFRL